MGGRGGDREKRHGDVTAKGESGFRPSMLLVPEAIEAKMSPPSNRTGFRPDAATARGFRLPDNQTGLDGGTRRPTRASDTYRHSNGGVSRCVTSGIRVSQTLHNTILSA